MRELIDRMAEQFAYIRRADQTNKRLAIFVHGFFGHYLDTWKGFPEKFASAQCENQITFRDWDYLFIGYDTKAQKTYLDISRLIVRRWNEALKGTGPFGGIKYDRVALIGHSLGTLGIRQALCAISIHGGEPLLSSLHNVAYFGTPQAGSTLAELAAAVVDIAEALRPTSQQLRMLYEWVKTGFIMKPWPKAFSLVGQGDWVVGSPYTYLINWDGDQAMKTSVYGHLAMCKPDSWEHEAIDFVREVLT